MDWMSRWEMGGVDCWTVSTLATTILVYDEGKDHFFLA